MTSKITSLSLLSVLFFGIAATAHADDSEKLDRILDTQTQILAKLDEIKQELGIVKIRATER